MFKIDQTKLHQQIDALKQQSNKIGSKINTYINQENLTNQKGLELCQVGKFLTLCEDETIDIDLLSEQPDFIINVNNRKVGLEHQLIVNQSEVKQNKSLDDLFRQAEKKFQSNYPSIKILANCHLISDQMKISKHGNKDSLVDQIVNYLHKLTSNLPSVKPQFIDEVDIMPHSGVNFEYISDISNIENIDASTLQESIKKKEQLITDYIKKSGINDQWLLLVIGQLSKDSYDFDLNNFKIDNSPFERIYLMKDFKSELFRLK